MNAAMLCGVLFSCTWFLHHFKRKNLISAQEPEPAHGAYPTPLHKELNSSCMHFTLKALRKQGFCCEIFSEQRSSLESRSRRRSRVCGLINQNILPSSVPSMMDTLSSLDRKGDSRNSALTWTRSKRSLSFTKRNSFISASHQSVISV